MKTINDNPLNGIPASYYTFHSVLVITDVLVEAICFSVKKSARFTVEAAALLYCAQNLRGVEDVSSPLPSILQAVPS
ncbi:MAG: hypothetical protein ACLUYV_04795 [Alistipes shahii]